MKIYETKERRTKRLLAKLDRRGSDASKQVMTRVTRIVRDVRRRGDRSLRGYAAKLDGLQPSQPLLISREVMEQALTEIPGMVRAALELAARNISDFARRQMPQEWDTEIASGVTAGQRVRPIDAVGCYVPSGRLSAALYFADDGDPGTGGGRKKDRCCFAEDPRATRLLLRRLLGRAGVLCDRRRACGGGAGVRYDMSVARVDKIVGPGNLYVTAAKKMVSHDCAIDMLAGPTEIGVTSERWSCGS